jgi:type II secretory pathway pseudopilin PulG
MTLVEVVVALAVTGLAIGAVVNGYHYCSNAAQKAALDQAASARALERLEETHSAKWDTSVWPPVDQLVASNFPPKSVVLDLAGTGAVVTSATLQTQISQESTNPPLKRVRVDCVWTYGGTRVITNTLETLRAPDQ